ncbi:succinate dehydrogenase, hydrophobic membrane anchor protein [soil metagenome]
MSMRTPLSRVRGLGSAKSGTEHWWHQRVTAVANVPLVLFLIIFIVRHVGASRAELIASVKQPLVGLGLALAILSITMHMRLGVQVIIEDYVHGAARIPTLLANTFFSVAIAAAALYAIAAMSFGA